jgi:sec-independent protein translocase protein TatC
VLAVLSAVLTPTPDAVTMLYMFVPMFGLYLLGIAVCYYFPGVPPDENEVEGIPRDEVAV